MDKAFLDYVAEKKAAARKEHTKNVKAVDQANQEAGALGAAAQVFQRTDRIVSGDFDLSVVVRPGDSIHGDLRETAGFTNGETITLNAGVFQKLMANAPDPKAKAEVLASLYGVNLHELAHALYSPRIDGHLVQRVLQYGERPFAILNALEDQRAERLFLATYPAATVHFHRMAMEQIIKRQTNETLPFLHLLVHARSWIDADVRRMARDLFQDATGASAQVGALIDEYVTLVLPRDDQRAEAIVLEIEDILSQADAPEDAMAGAPAHSHSEGEQDEEAQEQAQEAAAAADEASLDRDEDHQDSDEAEGSEGSGEGDQGDQDGEGSGEGEDSDDDAEGSDADGSESPEDAPGEGEDGAEGSGDQEGAEGAGAEQPEGSTDGPAEEGTGDSDTAGAGDPHAEQPDAPSPQDLKDAAREALQDLLDGQGWDDEVQDLDAKVRQELARSGADRANGPDAHVTTEPASDQARSQLRKVTRVFDDLRAELEAGWTHQEDSGRVNVAEVIRTRQTSPGNFDVFDRYQEGAEEAAGVELVLLVDASSSMDYQIGRASEAAWVIKTAVENLGGRVTVLSYNYNHAVVSHPGEKASRTTVPMLRAQGGTAPASALVEARRILARSLMPTKVMLTLTDGQWFGEGNVQLPSGRWVTLNEDALIEDLNRAGVVTALFGLSKAVAEHGDHSCLIAHDLKTIADLPMAAEKVVAEAIKRIARGL